jgi:heptose I phosphotransferase
MASTSALMPQEAADQPDLEPAGDGQMWFDGRFRGALGKAGLNGFAQVMDDSSGYCLRAFDDRESWRLRLQGPERSERGAYLKKHHVRTWRSRLRAWLGVGPGETAGRTEAENVAALTAVGVRVMGLIAYGERLHADGLLESFVLTEELEGYTELHHFLRQRFAQRDPQRCTTADRDLGRLIRGIADVVRCFHQAGYNHRDLYCCHFFIRESSPGRFDIKLIDLQRVQHRRRFRRRWVVKDLAQLAWSAPRDRIGCTQKMAFMRRYLGVRKLRPADKRLIREVLAKQSVMQRKLGVEA